MNRNAGRRWLINALAVLIVLLLLWSCAAFRLSSASASALAFPIKLRSQISADYGPDRLGRPIRSLRFSIVEDVMRDVGLAPEQAKQTQEAFELAMTTPVPTATLAPGELPAESTPTDTAAPSSTRRPTRTPTEVVADTATEAPSITATVTSSRTPTATEEPSKTPKEPSKTPTKTRTPTKTKTPTKTATAGGCLKDPMLVLLGNPDEGEAYTSGDKITGEAFAWDPDDVHPMTCSLDADYPEDNGKGISQVHFEIWKDGVGKVYERNQSSVKYCAFTGTPTCTVFTIGTPNWPYGGSAGTGTYILKAKAYDGAHWSEWDQITFYISLAAPSDTPLPPSATPTEAPSSTPTATLVPSDTPTPTEPPPSDTPAPTETPT